MASVHKGDDPHDGTDRKCAIGLRPLSQVSADSKDHSWTVRPFEKEVQDGTWDSDQMRQSLTTASKLIRIVNGTVDKRYHDPFIGFSRGDVYTEIGRPSWSLEKIMSWGTVMTRTDDLPALVQRTPKVFDDTKFYSILTESGYNVPLEQRYDNMSEDPQLLNGILSSVEADPSTDRSPNTMLKLVFASRRTKAPGTILQGEEEAFELVAPASTWVEPDEDSFDLFDRRPTTPEKENRFNKTFSTACKALGVLSEDGCANVKLSYATTDDFSVKVTDRTRAWDDHRCLWVVLTDLRPDAVGGKVTI